MRLLKLDCEGSEEEILLAFEKLEMIKNLGVVCGEWHGASRSDALKKILSPTHTFNSVPHPDPSVRDLGLFFATPSVVSL